jgi:hypothetical protein
MGMSGFEQGLAGVAGAGAGGFFSSLFSRPKPPQVKQFPLYNQQGTDLLNWLMSQGQQNANFGNIAQNEVNRFNTQTVPGLAERFTSMGQGAQSSSGFQDALGRAGAGLGQNLAGMQSQFGLQQLGMGLQPQFENVMMPGRGSGMQAGAQGAMSSISSLLPLLFML